MSKTNLNKMMNLWQLGTDGVPEFSHLRTILYFFLVLALSQLGCRNRSSELSAVGDTVDLSNPKYTYLERSTVYVVGDFTSCSGLLVSPWHVATADHCVREDTDLQVVFGKNFNRGVRTVVGRRFVVDLLAKENDHADLEIILLSAAAPETAIAHPPPYQSPGDAGEVIAVGFGGGKFGAAQMYLISYEQGSVTKFRDSTRRISDNPDVFHSLSINAGKMIGLEAVIQGDSGGPTFEKATGKPIGINFRAYPSKAEKDFSISENVRFDKGDIIHFGQFVKLDEYEDYIAQSINDMPPVKIDTSGLTKRQITCIDSDPLPLEKARNVGMKSVNQHAEYPGQGMMSGKLSLRAGSLQGFTNSAYEGLVINPQGQVIGQGSLDKKQIAWSEGQKKGFYRLMACVFRREDTTGDVVVHKTELTKFSKYSITELMQQFREDQKRRKSEKD